MSPFLPKSYQEKLAKFTAKKGVDVRQAPPRPVPQATPYDKWPGRWRLVGKRAIRKDRGIGDTVKRMVGPPGNLFKATFKKVFGVDCGCEKRETLLNARYPYTAEFWSAFQLPLHRRILAALLRLLTLR